jgi:hypothetical protein
MENVIFRKGLVVGIIILFIGASVIPIISGNSAITNIVKKYSTSKGVIFSDDFNDNTKDYSKWTEIFTNGTWEETNQRAEFQLYENNHQGERFEGIQSSAFNVSLTTSTSVIYSVDMISDIAHDYGQWVGNLFIEIQEDDNHWIQASYRRGTDDLRIQDSNDQDLTIIGNRDEGIWSNVIQIFSDRYKVDMDTFSSGWVYDSVFSSNSPTLKVRIYIDLGGSYDLFWRAGFDNVMVKEGQGGGNQPPEAPIINGPTTGKTGNSYTYTFVSEDPDGDDVYYQINWGDGVVEGWFGPNESSEIIIKSHTWTEKGTYLIMARAKDVYGAIGDWGQLKVSMPRTHTSTIMRLLERFPNAFPILRHLVTFY